MVETRFSSLGDMVSYLNKHLTKYFAPISVLTVVIAGIIGNWFALTEVFPYLIQRGFVVIGSLSGIVFLFCSYCVFYFYFLSVFTDPGIAPSKEEFPELTKTDISSYPICPKCLLSFDPLVLFFMLFI